MKFLKAIILSGLLSLVSTISYAQSDAQQAVIGYLSTSGCPSGSVSCFVPYGSAIGAGGTASASGIGSTAQETVIGYLSTTGCPSGSTVCFIQYGASFGQTTTWPVSGDVVISNGTNSPAGVAPVNGDCLVGNSTPAWVAGSCAAAGTVTVTGSPISGELVKFSSGTSITNANLTGDCTTTNTLVVTCSDFNGGTPFGTAAGVNTGTSGGTLCLLNSNCVFSGNDTFPTQAVGDNTQNAATTAFVTTAVNNAIAGVNPAVAVNAATTAASDTSAWTYANGVSGIGATFTGPTNTVITIDGFTFNAVGQRLLIKNDTQSPSGAFNGMYTLTALHTGLTGDVYTRALDYDTPSDMNNTGSIPVMSGTSNSSTSWVLTSSITTVGTSPLTFTQFTLNPTTLVTGPASATNNNLACYNGTTGKVIQDCGISTSGLVGQAAFHPGYLSGRIYTTPILFSTAAVTNFFQNGNTLYAMPFYCAKATTWTNMNIYSFSGSYNGEVGIYSNVNGQPSSLLVDAGSKAISTVAWQTYTINYAMTPGWYWFVFASNNSNPQIASANVAAASEYYTGLTTATSPPTTYPVTITGSWTYSAGALPTNFPTVTYSALQQVLIWIGN